MIEWIETFSVVLVLPLIALVAYFLARFILVRILVRTSRTLPGGLGEVVARHHLLARLAYIVPLQVMHYGTDYFPDAPEKLVGIISTLAHIMSFLVIGAAFAAGLDILNEVYQRRPYAASKPIKGYLQFVKMLIFTVIFLMIVSILLDRDIFALLAGLGAVIAVIFLIIYCRFSPSLVCAYFSTLRDTISTRNYFAQRVRNLLDNIAGDHACLAFHGGGAASSATVQIHRNYRGLAWIDALSY